MLSWCCTNDYSQYTVAITEWLTMLMKACWCRYVVMSCSYDNYNALIGYPHINVHHKKTNTHIDILMRND